MAQAEFKDVLAIDKDKLFDVIVRYEDYPKFVDGCSSVKVNRSADGRVQVTYQVSMMKDVTYILDHIEDKALGTVRWNLVDSDFFKKNVGSWELKSIGPNQTEVRYSLDVEFKIPVPGFILSRLVKGNLPDMVKSFEKQAKKGS